MLPRIRTAKPGKFLLSAVESIVAALRALVDGGAFDIHENEEEEDGKAKSGSEDYEPLAIEVFESVRGFVDAVAGDPWCSDSEPTVSFLPSLCLSTTSTYLLIL